MIYGQPPLTEDVLPPQYEKALQTFGKMCIDALVQKKFYFSRSEILKVMPESHENVIMGFLIKTNISFSRPLFNVGDYYQPLHKTFLEFVAAYYLKTLVTNKQQPSWLVEEVLLSLQDIAPESVEQVLLFTVEMLQDEAHVIFKELANIGFFLDWILGFSNLR